MDVTPGPGLVTLARTTPSLTEDVTKIGTNGIDTDDGAFVALIGGILGAVLLLLICMIAVLLWCLSRHKGSYATNEVDDDDDDDDNIYENDNESVGSDTALQSREPLKTKEEE